MKKKIISILVISVMLATLVFQTSGFAANDYSYIKVLLNSMGSPASVTFVVKGAYRIAEKSDQDLYPGITYTMKSAASGTGMTLSYSNGTATVSVALPATVNFKQYTNGTTKNFLYINNPGYGWRYYTGDMQFSRPSGASYLKLINTLFFETYLYGVVAYEMSSGWPAEALKVQAVCARTYSMRYMKANYGAAYYIGDTSSNQVYKGFPLNSDGTPQQSVISAVDSTRGQVITIGDPAALDVADGVFSASNGGQIRTANMHWGSTNTYHVFKDDPYDLENPSSPTFRYIFPVKNDAATLNTLSATDKNKVNTMTGLLMPKLVTALAAKGITCTASGITITGFKSAAPAVPVPGLPAGSHEFTQINVTVSVTATGNSTTPIQGRVTTSGGALNIRKTASSTATVLTTVPNGALLTVLNTAAASGWYKVQYGSVIGYASSAYITLIAPTPTPTPSPTPSPSPTDSPSASPAVSLSPSPTLSVSPSISPSASPTASDQSLVVYVAQAGGGASPTTTTFSGDITVTLAYLTKASGGSYTVHGELKTAFSSYSSLINTSNMWNLYAESSSDGKFLYVTARGYGHGVGMSQRGAQQMANKGFTYMQILDFYFNFETTKATMGMVTTTEKPLVQIPGKGAAAQLATVKTAGVAVRAAASASATSIATLAQGSTVEVLAISGDWYHVLNAAAGVVGWSCSKSGSTTAISLNAPPATASPSVSASASPSPSPSLSPSSGSSASDSPSPSPSPTPSPSPSSPVVVTQTATPTPTPTPTPAPVTLAPVYGTAHVTSYLSLRKTASSSASCLVKIPKNAKMTVLMVHTTASWLKVTYLGKTGYVLSHYVIVGGNSAYRAGTVTTSSLNVRSGAGTSCSVLGTLKSGNTIVITGSTKSGGKTWYMFTYGSKTGYLDSSYIRKQAV